jgi:hypothetical protein
LLESRLDENFVTLQVVIASDKELASELQHEEGARKTLDELKKAVVSSRTSRKFQLRRPTRGPQTQKRSNSKKQSRGYMNAMIKKKRKEGKKWSNEDGLLKRPRKIYITPFKCSNSNGV